MYHWVSILTRRERRVQRQLVLYHVYIYNSSFNPHPSRTTGATHAGFSQNPTSSRFQSSPVANDGCNLFRPMYLNARMACFNPHPSRTTGATLRILSISFLRRCFNPHPSRTTGATRRAAASRRSTRPVSILTRRERRVQPRAPQRQHVAQVFQSSPVANDGCNGFRPFTVCLSSCVSILTRRERRVQHAVTAHPASCLLMFQSSPVANDGCNSSRLPRRSWRCSRFNPHPSRTTGATAPTRRACHSVSRFNPHPSRTTGATSIVRMAVGVSLMRFNPHPSRTTGATLSTAIPQAGRQQVSILTRRERRVQPCVSSGVALRL